MVFDNELVHIEFGSKAKLDNHDANAIAFAAKQLLADSPEEISVLLLMPPAEFVASAHSLPGISKENLISALRLQTETILPSYEESLSLAIDDNSSDGNSDSIALWLPQTKLDELFEAFKEQNIFLAAIKPRILNSKIENSDAELLDEDTNDVTFVVFRDGILRVWQQVNKLDFDQEGFSDQWTSSLKAHSNISIKEHS